MNIIVVFTLCWLEGVVSQCFWQLFCRGLLAYGGGPDRRNPVKNGAIKKVYPLKIAVEKVKTRSNS